MRYGKHIIEKSYIDGKQVSVKGWLQESVAIVDKAQLLNETLTCLDLVLDHVTDTLEVTIKRNKEGKLMLVKKHRVS